MADKNLEDLYKSIYEKKADKEQTKLLGNAQNMQMMMIVLMTTTTIGQGKVK